MDNHGHLTFHGRAMCVLNGFNGPTLLYNGYLFHGNESRALPQAYRSLSLSLVLGLALT